MKLLYRKHGYPIVIRSGPLGLAMAKAYELELDSKIKPNTYKVQKQEELKTY